MKRFFATILISVSLLSVSVHGKGPKPESLDSDSLFLIGKQAYISEDFRQAIRFLDYYVLNYPATAEIAEAQYYLASSYFKLGRFQEASVEFEFCYKQFPGSEFAEEAHIRTAEAIFEISEPYYKEQVLTLNAKKKAESFLNKYPNSEFADDARRLLSRIADKLARKELEAAKLYFKFKEYEAAVMSLEYILAHFPRADKTKPETKYYLGRCKAELGESEEAQAILEELLENPDWGKKAQKTLDRITQEK